MKNKTRLILGFLALISHLKLTAQHGEHTPSTDRPSTHGMLIFGTEKVYASHLPMFHTPHDYQIILELALDKKTKAQFVADQKAHPEMPTYTLVPEKFVLPDMVKNPRLFKAKLVRGHFERGGVEITKEVEITIAKVVVFKKFDPSVLHTKSTEFWLFGNDKEQFMAHDISQKPDFEQIIQIKAQLNPKETAMKIVLNAENNAPIGVSGNDVTFKNGSSEQRIGLLKQMYLEFDDLKE
jgi:hypothetical protein